jgi:glyoxylase-like metal-dependent hydrolase (beta-lactamase superfamily II)
VTKLHVRESEMVVHPIIVPTRSSLKSINLYILEDKGTLSLIDTGFNNDKCLNYLLNALYMNEFSLQDLDQIIVTHNHEDHVGLVDRIVSSHNIPVYAPEKSINRLKRDREFFEMRIEFFRSLYKEMGCGDQGAQQIEKLKAALQNHEEKKVQSDISPIKEGSFLSLEPIKTPGHSPDHMVFYNRNNKWLFGGDLLIKHISSNALVEPNREGNRILTLLEHEGSLKKCLELDLEVVYPGHGDVINNPKELITKRLASIKRKADKILLKIEEGLETGSQLALAMYGDKYESQFSLVMSEIIGHLDYLEAHENVRKEQQNGIWHYYSIK